MEVITYSHSDLNEVLGHYVVINLREDKFAEYRNEFKRISATFDNFLATIEITEREKDGLADSSELGPFEKVKYSFSNLKLVHYAIDKSIFGSCLTKATEMVEAFENMDGFQFEVYSNGLDNDHIGRILVAKEGIHIFPFGSNNSLNNCFNEWFDDRNSE